MEKYYGIIRWSPEDVMAAAKDNGVSLTYKQAVEWWKKNEKAFIDMMTEAGNEILSYMDF